MFGTLVVQLPTAMGHEGGSLLVRHQGEQKVFAWQDPDGIYGTTQQVGLRATFPGDAQLPSVPVRCAAFYGDCEHELRLITRGV